MSRRPAVAAALLLFLSGVASAAVDPAGCAITIAKVELKSDTGRWITVAEPDHRVDIVREEPGFSFFNDGRVPAGKYTNFRITLLDTVKVTTPSGDIFRQSVSRPGRGPEITGLGAFIEPLTIGRSSFIGVRFGLDLRASVDGSGKTYVFTPPRTVEWAELTIDETSKRVNKNEIAILYP